MLAEAQLSERGMRPDQKHPRETSFVSQDSRGSAGEGSERDCLQEPVIEAGRLLLVSSANRLFGTRDVGHENQAEDMSSASAR